MVKVGINGFGRIGKCILRAYLENHQDFKANNIITENELHLIQKRDCFN